MSCPCRAPAVLRPCRSESGFSRPWHSTTGARHGHGMGTAWLVWINIGRLSTACGRPAQVRLLLATTQAVTKAVNQNATAFWICLIVLMTMETADYKEYELNLRFKVSLSSVVMLRLHCVFFFWFYVGNNSLKFSNFEIPILKYWKHFCIFFFRRPNIVWNSPSSSFDQNTLRIQYNYFTDFPSSERM